MPSYVYAVATENGLNFGHLIAGFGLADRPPSAYQRRVYLDLNARVFYLDTGTDWQPIGANEAASSILSKLLTVDGAGSQLDADLLDGLQATAFMRNLGNVASFRGGLLSERPASGAPGEYYFSTDVGRLSEGNGTGWATRAVSRFDDLIQKNHKAQHAAGGADPLTPADVGAIPASQKGTASGVGSLDANAKQPLTEVNAAVLGGARRQGTWDASLGTAPATLADNDADRGKYWEVSVAGTTLLGGKNDWNPGDWIIWEGLDWGWVDNTDRVGSVNGRTGAVTGLAESNDSRFHTRNHNLFSGDHPDVDTADVRADGDVLVWRSTPAKYLHEPPGAASVGDASTTAKGVTLLNEAATDPANPRVIVQNSSLLATHIEGLAVEFGGAAALSIQAGSAWIPALNRVLNVPSTISKSALALTANTWYYAYLFDNAGAPDVEVSTVAPAAPYKGTARIKGGATPDNTRRYLGAARTNGVAAFFNFLRQGRLVKYRENTTGTPFRALSGGVATASTGVSLAVLVPPTTRVGIVKLQNTGSDRSPSFGTPDGMGGIVATVFALAPGNELSEPFPLGASQELFYSYAVAPTSGGAFVDVIGYHEEV